MEPRDDRRARDDRPALDRELLAGVRRRDAAALERFFDAYYDRVYGYVARLIGDAHAAEDVTHDIFLRLHGAAGRLDPDRDPTPWVFAVAANGVRDHWRRAARRRPPVALSPAQLAEIPGPGDGSLERLGHADDARLITTALASLSDADREVILLRAYEDLDSGEIAAMLHARPDAIRQRYTRAVARLGRAYRALLDGTP